jgi:hypothetical protein
MTGHPGESWFQPTSAAEFDVAADDFSQLEIRTTNGQFCYFYNTGVGRLAKDFVLHRGPQVDTLCEVILIRKGELFTPRLALWKKDKTKKPADVATEAARPDVSRPRSIKSRVDVGHCHENLWKLIEFLRTYKGISLPKHEFRVASKEVSELSAVLEGHDRAGVLSAVKAYLGGQVSEQDLEMLLDRRRTLTHFKRLLDDPDFFKHERSVHGPRVEDVWQEFFEANTWIFGYGLTFVACEKYTDQKLEQITSGADVFSGAGKRSDALMRTKGFLQTLIFAEIKTHATDLLDNRPYRKPDVYRVSDELSGAVAQVHKTAHKAVRRTLDLHQSHSPDGSFQFEISAVSPRKVVIIGDLRKLHDDGRVNVEKMSSFEIFRRSQLGIDIITFDELYERTRFIVEHQGIRANLS